MIYILISTPAHQAPLHLWASCPGESGESTIVETQGKEPTKTKCLKINFHLYPAAASVIFA